MTDQLMSESGASTASTLAPKHYVVVAAKRIQPWIARTPLLRLVRGASNALHLETTKAKIDDALMVELTALGAGVVEKENAVDGVVVLCVSPPENSAAVAELVVNHLASVLPGLDWTAWWATASTYVEAQDQAKFFDPTIAMGDVSENPVVKACETCRQEPGLKTEKFPDSSNSTAQVRWVDRFIGLDCATRYEHNETRGDWDDVSGEWPKNFEELAQRGGLSTRSGVQPQAIGRRDSRNHLATISADGNRMGEFFRTVSEAGPSFAEFRQTASVLLDDHLKQEVRAAAASVSRDADVKAVLAHFIGGDDILASVAAPHAWEFARALVCGFGNIREALTSEIEKVTPQSDRDVAAQDAITTAIADVSLGVGMVFSHTSHPFRHCQQVAHAAMGEAKLRGGAELRRTILGGDPHAPREGSCVAWVDLTEGTLPSQEQVLALHEMADRLDAPASGVLALPPSARHQLAAILASTSVGERQTAVDLWWKRTRANRADLVANPSQAKITLEPAGQLPALLSLARWWPDLATASSVDSLDAAHQVDETIEVGAP